MNTSSQNVSALRKGVSFLFILILLATFTVPVQGQKMKPPTDAEISQAKKLREKYNPENDEKEEGQNAVLLNSFDEYSFSLNKEKNKVIVSEKSSETIMSITSLLVKS